MKIDATQWGSNYPTQTNGIRQGSQEHMPMAKGQGSGDPIAREKQISDEQVVKAVEKANKSFQPFDRRFEISVHEKTNTIMVKVINSTNDELIREVPPEKILDMVAHMLEVAGILVDKKV